MFRRTIRRRVYLGNIRVPIGCNHNVIQFAVDTLISNLDYDYTTEQEPNFVPADEKVISELPTNIDSHATECCICMSNDRGDSTTLPCNHEFHTPCITNWLKVSGNCPVCRSNPSIQQKYTFI